jgi:16S rRNA (cytosine967-C5)-methyltransferase
VQTKVVDSSDAGAVSGEIQGEYDWVISDVPCSGSGTWARTPEQFYFFHPDKLLHFADLQWSIARNTCRKVKPGGYFLYITCSVFTAENEAVVQRLLQTNPDMELVAEQLLNGVDMQADSMYAALIQRKP